MMHNEGIYHCSIRTMYRILSEHGEVRERRRNVSTTLRHPQAAFSEPRSVKDGA